MNIVIHSGFCWSKWSPHSQDLETSGLGGSQIAAARVSHALVALGHRVVLFGDFLTHSLKECTEENGKEGMLVLKPLEAYVQFVCDVSRPVIDLLVVSRYANLLYFGTNVRHTFLWCHDIVPFGTTDLVAACKHIHPKPNLTVLALSEWHCSRLQNLFSPHASLLTTKVVKTSNGIDKDLFQDEPWSCIVPRRFVYSSACYRGLDVVFQCWSGIRMQFPDSELHVFTDFESPLVQTKMSSLSESLRQTAQKLDGVVLHGFVGQKPLRDHLYSADVWFYPTSFEETYCITALECQASGTLCVCTPVAALNETVGKQRGVILPPRKLFQSDPDYVDALVEKVCTVLQSREETFPMRRKARQWALQQTWNIVATNWLDMIGCPI